MALHCVLEQRYINPCLYWTRPDIPNFFDRDVKNQIEQSIRVCVINIQGFMSVNCIYKCVLYCMFCISVYLCICPVLY